MGRVNIEKYSLGYGLLKTITTLWHNHAHYRKVIIIGRENISRSDHNIFAPNHQNAVMDAMAIICTIWGQHVFLARSDIYRKKLIASILYFLKILPIYRIRDGFDALKHNDEIFEKTIDVILNKNGLVILPEGNHEGFRRLRQLKKGIFRIAFQTEEAKNYELGIKIVPVGLDYSDYQNIRQVLTVTYGKPISVSEYYDLHKDNPQKAYNELRKRLSDEMKKIIVHIGSTEDYEAINELREIVNGEFRTDKKNPKVFRDKELISKLEHAAETKPDIYKNICETSLKIKQVSKKLGLSYRFLGKPKPRIIINFFASLGLVLLLPLFLFGFILNYLFYKIPRLPTRKIKDIMFHSSVKFIVSLILGIILFPVYTILAFALIQQWWLAGIIVLGIPPSGFFAWNYLQIWKRLREGLRIRKYSRLRKKEFMILGEEYTKLRDDLAKI